MKIRMMLLIGSVAIAWLLTGCAMYKNPSVCERTVRGALANMPSSGALSISHVGVAAHGSRVVVEGTVEQAPVGASAAQAQKVAAPAPVAAECTFEQNKLLSFRWLNSPLKNASPSSSGGGGE